MISPEDLQLGKLAVQRGLLLPEQLGEASAAAASSGASLLGVLRERGLLDAAQERSLRGQILGDADSPAASEHGASKTATLRPSVSFLISKSLGFTPDLQLGSGDSPSATPLTPPEDQSLPVPSSSKYEIWGEIAAGGMGRIYLAYDRDINRKVAMKVMRDHGQHHPARVKRFIEEIQATGQLEHPSIVPIYDMGLMQDGQPFFIMRYVKGRSLEAIIAELSRQGGGVTESAGEFGRVRLLSIVHQICMAMHFAHEKGVIHRDLKPANVMVGSYGEVQIMDWGLAKVRGRQETTDLASAIDLARPQEHPATLVGQVIGTPAYMPPEQAAGRASSADARSDVYALGALLYSLLTLEPPVPGATTAEVLERVKAGDFPTPRTRSPGRDIPETLEDICLRAMALRPEDRYASARELADDLTSYLEGHRERERNHTLAEHHYAEGMRLAVRFNSLRHTLRDLTERAEKEQRSVQPWWPFEQRRHVFETRAAVSRGQRELAETFAAATEQLYRALRYERTHEPSRAALADLYLERFRQSEEAGNLNDQIMYRNLVERYHDGRYAQLLVGDGALWLATQPVASEAFISRYDTEQPAFTLEDESYLGSTPLRGHPLAMGSYLIRVVSPGARETAIPILIERAGETRLEVTLRTDEDIGADFVYVPGGEVTLGGDPEANSPRKPFVADRADFFVGRYPVTVERYREFLEALHRAGRTEEALRRVPRDSPEGGAFWELDDEGTFTPAERFAAHYRPRYPVSSVSWEDAMAYCEWLSDALGRIVSLPHDQDWEKAARGADLRFFPWGNEHDYTFANNAHSHEAGGRLVPVGTFPMDRSPYGVMDLTGNVRELCRNSPTPTYSHAAVIKGGGFSTPGLDARAAGRTMVGKELVRRVVGFRVAIYPHGLPEDELPEWPAPEAPE